MKPCAATVVVILSLKKKKKKTEKCIYFNEELEPISSAKSLFSPILFQIHITVLIYLVWKINLAVVGLMDGVSGKF